MKKCLFCGKTPPEYSNYCSWDCSVQHALKLGGRVFCPNGLPISCIKHDGSCLEHEHGDHPDYKFPVDVVFTGTVPVDLEEHDCSFMPQQHALINVDENVATTLYEYGFYSFSTLTGMNLSRPRYETSEWRLSDDSLVQIRRRFSK